MKFVVIGEPPRASVEALMAMFSPHKPVVDAFVSRADHQLRQLPAGNRTQYVEGYTAPTFADLFENAPFPE